MQGTENLGPSGEGQKGNSSRADLGHANRPLARQACDPLHFGIDLLAEPIKLDGHGQRSGPTRRGAVRHSDTGSQKGDGLCPEVRMLGDEVQTTEIVAQLIGHWADYPSMMRVGMRLAVWDRPGEFETGLDVMLAHFASRPGGRA